MKEARITIEAHGSVSVSEDMILSDVTGDLSPEYQLSHGESVVLDTNPPVEVICLEQ